VYKSIMLKLLLPMIIIALLSSVVLFGCEKEGAAVAEEEEEEEAVVAEKEEEEEKEAVLLEVAVEQPEYEAQCEAIWQVFLDDNPNITMEFSSYNEDELPALAARIAGGDPLDIDERRYATADNYEQWVNLLDIDFQYWDNFGYDAKNAWGELRGVEDYCPIVWPFAGILSSFVYDAGATEAAGIDMSGLTTWDAVDAMLAELKAYVDQDDTLEYVISTGNHPWCWPVMLANPIMTSLDADAQDKLFKLISGETAWTNMDENENPMVLFFKWLKDYYDKGYFPNEFWKVTWDDYEAGLVAGTGILTIHGPWIWDKLETANPEIQLSGFPFPPNSEGTCIALPPDVLSEGVATGIYSDPNRTDAETEAVIKAFNWFHSPETIKMRCEALNKVPNYDLSSVGGADLVGSQYLSINKAIEDGEFGDATLASGILGLDKGDKWYKEGEPSVKLGDDIMALWGQYLSEEITLEELMATYQQRWENAYDVK